VSRVPAGGLHLWVVVPPGRQMPIIDAARAAGVAISSGDGYFAAEPAGAFLRVGFAATADLAQLEEGARRLGEVARSARA